MIIVTFMDKIRRVVSSYTGDRVGRWTLTLSYHLGGGGGAYWDGVLLREGDAYTMVQIPFGPQESPMLLKGFPFVLPGSSNNVKQINTVAASMMAKDWKRILGCMAEYDVLVASSELERVSWYQYDTSKWQRHQRAVCTKLRRRGGIIRSCSDLAQLQIALELLENDAQSSPVNDWCSSKEYASTAARALGGVLDIK